MRCPAGAVALIACAALATACDSDAGSPRSGSPTAASSADPARCVVADPEGELILHPGSLTATGDGLTLDGVRLASAENLDVVETDTVAFSGSSTVRGIILDYPPMKNAGLADSLADWDKREPLEGRELTPDDGQQAVLVVVRLSDTTSPGHLTGVELSTTPEDDARSYPQPVLVKPHGEPCTVDDIASTHSWIG
jgi:hypothetical protein